MCSIINVYFVQKFKIDNNDSAREQSLHPKKSQRLFSSPSQFPGKEKRKVKECPDLQLSESIYIL